MTKADRDRGRGMLHRGSASFNRASGDAEVHSRLLGEAIARQAASDAIVKHLGDLLESVSALCEAAGMMQNAYSYMNGNQPVTGARDFFLELGQAYGAIDVHQSLFAIQSGMSHVLGELRRRGEQT